MQTPPSAPGLESLPARPAALPEAGSFFHRHYRLLAALTLAVAALNVGVRLDREVVTAWDESLYATSAAEMVRSGNWLVTTFHGQVDYYNSKPPLNVWLIATSFKLFGISLWSLRLPSALAAWLTIALLQWWCRRCFGARVAIIATLVLSTTFGFIYVHSARSGNPDAWLTLDLLLTVVTLWSARTSPARLAWLGPLAAAAFLLKGTAVLLPFLLIVIVLAIQGVPAGGWRALAGAAALFLAPTVAWAVARWQFDRWRFFDALVNYDFIARATTKLEGHEHGWFYYLDVLQKDHYDWLITTIVLGAVLLLTRHMQPPSVRGRVTRDVRVLLGVWAAVTLLIPTFMATKVPWYLNLFYPVFAIGVAMVISMAIERFGSTGRGLERVAVASMVLLAFGLAEGKLVWYSYRQRDVANSIQGVFLAPNASFAGRSVVSATWDPADYFVLQHIAHGVPVTRPAEEPGPASQADDLPSSDTP
jgi:4-amino-4-deoxy-L-arabinose transferase-like glycosyltransferase